VAVVVNIDYVAWNHYKRDGSGWRHWYVDETGANEVVINYTDASIIHFVTIPPINIQAGQSNSCAQLVADDPADECSIRTYAMVLNAAHTYNLTLDYKYDVAGVTSLLSVQRTSDHYYWDEVTQTWQAAASTVTIVNSLTRVRTTFMTNIQTALPDNLIIKIAIDPAMVPHNLYVYKVHLRN